MDPSKPRNEIRRAFATDDPHGNAQPTATDDRDAAHSVMRRTHCPRRSVSGHTTGIENVAQSARTSPGHDDENPRSANREP